MSIKAKYKNKQIMKAIACERIKKLFSLAKDTYKEDMTLANRYVTLARLTSMKYKVKIDSENKRLICKHCKILLIPSRNSRVRITGKTITYYCNECKNFTRLGYKNKKKGTDVKAKEAVDIKVKKDKSNNNEEDKQLS